MCGINGFTYRDGELLRQMHQQTRHRGPDDDGFFETETISFAHNRLSIIDVSSGGHQPMVSSDCRYTLVFNGEIYNYRELRQELEGMGERFASVSDTEVLLRAWSVWGEACLNKLNGIFAFAIWDRDKECVSLVRDPVGVKPLYYRSEQGKLWFSSELKALVKVGKGRPNIDQVSLDIYLRLLYVPAPRTMLEGIYKLPAGHLLRFQKGVHELVSWTCIEEGERISSYQEARALVRDTVQASVARQLVSDRPLGVFLSGGIDSSIVLAAMRQVVSGSIETLTVSFTSSVDQQKYNADAELARKTAQHFGTNHHEVVVTPEDVMRVFDEVIWHMDEPIANHIQPATYLLAQAAKPHITVALGGDGGDELFGGYARYWYQAMIERVRGFGGVLPAAGLVRMGIEGKWGQFAKCVAQPMGTDRHLAFLLQKEQAIMRVRRGYSSQASDKALHEIFDPLFALPWQDRVNQSMAADVSTWLADESLMRSDKMTMAHGLEERVPLLDLELVRLAMRIPSKWKIGSREQGKRILIDAWKDVLPPHVLEQEKRAFMSPAAKWMRGTMYEFVRERLRAGGRGEFGALVDFGAAEELLKDHVDKTQYNLHLIWALVCLEGWGRKISV